MPHKPKLSTKKEMLDYIHTLEESLKSEILHSNRLQGYLNKLRARWGDARVNEGILR